MQCPSDNVTLGTRLSSWGTRLGIVLVLILEAVLSVTRVSHFGDTSGWLAVILPVWLFVEEFRAAKPSGPSRTYSGCTEARRGSGCQPAQRIQQ